MSVHTKHVAASSLVSVEQARLKIVIKKNVLNYNNIKSYPLHTNCWSR